MTDDAWRELHQAINHGGWRWVYGVPNGLRNQFYKLSIDETNQKIFHWPSHLNPDFTEERRQELIRLYGGESSSGYIHQVLGLHGSPEEGVFNADDYSLCVNSSLEHWEGIFSKSDFENSDIWESFSLIYPDDVKVFFLGADLGYAQDPTELVVWAILDSHLAAILRISLRNVPYHIQQDVIAYLHSQYHFAGIGIDRGGAGQAVIDQIVSTHSEFSQIIKRGSDGELGYAFGSNFLIGYEEDGRPRFRPIKQFMTDLIREGLEKRRLIFPNSRDREEQYINHSCRLGPQGQIIYNKGNDHILDADRCAVLAWYQTLHPDPIPHPLDPGGFLEGI